MISTNPWTEPYEVLEDGLVIHDLAHVHRRESKDLSSAHRELTGGQSKHQVSGIRLGNLTSLIPVAKRL